MVQNKDYEVYLNDEPSTMVIVSNVETVNFAGDRLVMFNAEGDMLAGFERNQYKYFNRMGG